MLLFINMQIFNCIFVLMNIGILHISVNIKDVNRK